MTKTAVMPIYCKNPLKTFFSETSRPMTSKRGIQYLRLGPYKMYRVATGQEKSGNSIFLQDQGKVREFCKLVRENLNSEKVREKSWNFIILAQNMCCSRYFDYLICEKSFDFFKSVDFFSRSKL